MLVTGTLVYGKGDKMEAKAEGLLGEGEERLFAPVATADPGQAQPAAVPGAHRRSSGGTAPIAMRATPGSLKARLAPSSLLACALACQDPNLWHYAIAFLEVDGSVGAVPVAMRTAPGSAHLPIFKVFAGKPHLLGLLRMKLSTRGSMMHCHVHLMPCSTSVCRELPLHSWLHADKAMPMWLT